MEKRKRLAKKVLLIGWDAADWQMIDPLIQQGKMPNLAKFIKNGVRGNLATIQPMLSPMLWTSIATGKRADKHGICGFVEPNSDATDVRPASSTSRKTKALWNILTQENLRSLVVNWYASFPAEPINGWMVSDYFTMLGDKRGNIGKIPKRCTHPQNLVNDIIPFLVKRDEINAEDILPFIPRLGEIDLDKDNRPARLGDILIDTAGIQATTTHLLEKEEWDFAAVFFSAIDTCGHYFMPYHPPQKSDITQRDYELYKRVMEGCYCFHDMLLQALLHYAGDDTTVIIVSDHGFKSGSMRPSEKLAQTEPESSHRSIGIACVKGPGIKKDQTLYGATVLDVTPTILNLLGLPAGMDMDGRSWLEIFEEPVKIDPIFSWEMKEGEAGMHPEEETLTPEQATAMLSQLVDLGYIDPPDSDAQKRVNNAMRTNKLNLVSALLDSRRCEQAIPLLEELIEGNDNHKTSYQIKLINTYLKAGKIDLAEKTFESLPKDAKETIDLIILEAEILFHKNQPKQALTCLEKVEKIMPSWANLHFMKGQGYMMLDEWAKAEEMMQKALQYDSDSPFVNNALAQLYLQLGQSDKKTLSKALEHGLEAVSLMHHFPQAHYNLGLILASLEKDGEAIQAFEVCAGMAKGHASVYAWLAKLYRKNNRDLNKARNYEALLREAQKNNFFTID